MSARHVPSLVRFAAAGLLLVAGCTENPFDPLDPNDHTAGDKPSGAARLVSFASPAELLNYFHGQAVARMSQRGAFGVAELATADAALAPAAADGESFTTTNLQEADVDEADVFKSDGEHFYIARGSTLEVVRAAPMEQLARVSQIELARPIDSMYLTGSHLIVLSQQFVVPADGRDVFITIWPPYYVANSLLVTQVDVSDPTSPAIVAEVELDGTLTASRRVGDALVLILSIVPDLPASGGANAIRRLALGDVLPKARSAGAARELVPWENWLRPDSPEGYYMTAVVTLDARDVRRQHSSIAVMGDAGTVYASRRALYLTDRQYDPLTNVRESTAVHKLAFDESGQVRYVASGTVPGRLLNQFSLSENEGMLRVATTITNVAAFTEQVNRGANVAGRGGANAAAAAADAPTAAGDDGGGVRPPDDVDVSPPRPAPRVTPSSAVLVLAERDGELAVIGSVVDLAPGEQIYAVRFLGQRGFVVTFRQVDPLFALDLSEPTEPRVVGELKIPGYSDYLHPFGENRIIGVGRSVLVNGFGGAVPDKLQISLFDVSDLSRPALVQQVEAGGHGSASDVSETHKAFTITSDGIMGIPARLTDASRPFSFETAFDGVLWYAVSDAGLRELGGVSRLTAGETMTYTPWRRAAVIGDVLYAISPDRVRAAHLGSIGSAAGVVLE